MLYTPGVIQWTSKFERLMNKLSDPYFFIDFSSLHHGQKQLVLYIYLYKYKTLKV